MLKNITSCVAGVIFNEGVWFYVAYDPQGEKVSARGSCVKKAKEEKQVDISNEKRAKVPEIQVMEVDRSASDDE